MGWPGMEGLNMKITKVDGGKPDEGTTAKTLSIITLLRDLATDWHNQPIADVCNEALAELAENR